MRPLLLSILLLFFSLSVWAGPNDSLWLHERNAMGEVWYQAKKDETMETISKLFHLPLMDILNANSNSPYTITQPTIVKLPVGNYQLLHTATPPLDSKPVYYKVGKDVNWEHIVHLTGTAVETLRTMNHCYCETVTTGQVIIAGYVLYGGKDEVEPVVPVIADTAGKSPMQVLYEQQTSGIQNVVTDRGSAIFFDNKGSGKAIYAFFNLVPRGTVIKIVNPGNGKVVYAKVIGTVPETGRFDKALLGLSSNARSALGTAGDRTWCEVSYVGY